MTAGAETPNYFRACASAAAPVTLGNPSPAPTHPVWLISSSPDGIPCTCTQDRYDGKERRGTVILTATTTTGNKVRISCGDIVLNVDEKLVSRDG
jgi:hypothetical protein